MTFISEWISIRPYCERQEQYENTAISDRTLSTQALLPSFFSSLRQHSLLVLSADYSRELEVGSHEGQSKASTEEGGHTQGDTDAVLGSGLEGHCVTLQMEGGKI